MLRMTTKSKQISLHRDRDNSIEYFRLQALFRDIEGLVPDHHNRANIGNSLVVQWLGLRALTAKGLGSIPGRGTKIPKAEWCGQKKGHGGREEATPPSH